MGKSKTTTQTAYSQGRSSADFTRVFQIPSYTRNKEHHASYYKTLPHQTTVWSRLLQAQNQRKCTSLFIIFSVQNVYQILILSNAFFLKILVHKKNKNEFAAWKKPCTCAHITGYQQYSTPSTGMPGLHTISTVQNSSVCHLYSILTQPLKFFNIQLLLTMSSCLHSSLQ